ncbi:MAG TPA: right-handed parallel beta-helix repeat-containing protein, partial [Flavisolibacter sp.]|nr:right-handed parallel beta-helix repeat-containing protein [Flavisolibacter sp.]
MKREKNQHGTTSRPMLRRSWYIVVLATALLAAGCQKEIATTSGNGGDVAASKAPPKAPVLVVHAGNSIQAAINSAGAGSVIKIEAGLYKESLTVNKPITLMGEDGVILQNPGEEDYGIVVQDGADGFALKNITIRGFKQRALFMTYVDGFLLSHVTVISNGEFGLFAEYCKNGLIEHCEGTGHTETSVFVGQSTNVTISQNKSYANVIGYEVENSSYVTLDKNHAYDNSVGIMCLLVPGRITKESSNITITKNQVRENNRPNFSAPPEMESVLPAGVGILMLGINNSLVQDNLVTENQFTGVAVVSTLVMALLAN